MRGIFEWVDAQQSSVALRESLNAYPILLTTHVVSVCIFAGLIAYWDLRLLGVTMKWVPVSSIPRRVFPWALAGFGVALVTGGLLLYSKPLTYYANFYFWAKSCMILLAGVNMAIFHFTTERSVAQWELEDRPPFGARFAGIASLLLWAGVVMTGRMMAYSGLAPDWWDALGIQ